MTIDYTIANITRLSSATGCSKETVEKALMTAGATESIFSFSQSSCFALKGASAKNMLYTPSRISTEIDLEYVDMGVPYRESFGVNLSRMLVPYMSISFDRLSSAKGQTEAYACKYSNYNRNMSRFSVIIDYGSREPEPVIQKTVKVLGYEGDLPVNTFGLDKLNRDIFDSLVQRTSPVDVYDLFICITENNVRSREELYGICGQSVGRYFEDVLAYTKAKLKSLTERDFRYFLEPLLLKGVVFDWHEAVYKIASLL
ncbi:MAG: hypothetical protein LUE27_07485 [Clostridia bacterium]|nr:hypothetical protein [Clostridia bacterium]